MSMIRPLLEQLRYMEEHEEKSEYRYAFRKAADTIEALSAKLQAANMENGGGWIADREPEESGYYLVTYHEWSNGDFLHKFDDTYVKRLHYQKSEQFIGWNFPKCVDKRAEEDMNVEVLAWCYLPEPYRP